MKRSVKITSIPDFQIPLVFAYVFCDSILTLFVIFISFGRPQDGMSVLCLIWITYCILLTAPIMFLGNSTKNEVEIMRKSHKILNSNFFQGKRIEQGIHKAINAEKCENIIEKLSKFSHQISSRRLGFACELFSYDLKVYFSVIQFEI